MDISVVLPIYDEENSIKTLFLDIHKNLTRLGKKFEVIMVNDGSKDNTANVLDTLAIEYPEQAKILHLSRNFGQTAATACGIDHCSGEIVIIMDSDGQNSPEDFEAMLAKMDEGFDIIAGWRKNRKDGFFRVFLSKIANYIIRKITKVHIKDLGCSLKVYRKSVLEQIKLYGEMHRLLPIYAVWTGVKYTNIPVMHYPRQFGKSNYGFSRIFKVLADIWLLHFTKRYFTKPIYFFWKLACFPLIFAFVSFIIYIYVWIFKGDGLTYYLPATFLFLMFALVLICFGIMAEVLMRVYYESQHKTIYLVKNKSPNLEK